MKTFRLILVPILVGVALAWGVIVAVDSVAQHRSTAAESRCNVNAAIMGGTKTCMDTPGCFYTAPDVVEAYASLRYYSAHCKANERAE